MDNPITAREGMEDEMEKTSVDTYSGYRHNRYDGYKSSRGILVACGGTGTADCFADSDDFEIDENIFNGNKKIDHKIVLNNLDCSDSELADLRDVNDSEYTEHVEYWGNYKYVVRFERENGELVVIADVNGDNVKFLVK